MTSSPASFVRGKITAWNVTAQQQVGANMSVQLSYVANRQRDMTRSTNQNYGQIGGGVASQPFFQSIGTNAAINLLEPARQGPTTTRSSCTCRSACRTASRSPPPTP